MRRCLLLLCCLALLACQGEQDELRLGSNRWLGYAPFYLADDLNWLESSRIRLVEYPSATGVLRGVRNGLLDGGLLTLDEAFKLQSEGHDLELLLVADISLGADALYARAPLRNLADLRNRRIGVENTALGAFILSRVLELAELRRDQVRIVDLPVHEHVSAMAAGRIDAVISFASQGPALQALGARRIFDSRELPYEIIDVLVVRRDRVSPARRKALQALWYDSLRIWRENPQNSEERLQRRLGLDAADLQLTREGLLLGDAALNRQWLEQGQLRDNLQQLHDYLLRIGLLRKPGNPDALLPQCREDAPC
ncbi:ABC transporter substrate-binding protein [Pseudomonas fluvialis]|uniref:ABC transporter substrate-binding protein n=1 Tax=Pseudomonas fluvialis TaxID=1793966 RepID=UPI0035B2FC0B